MTLRHQKPGVPYKGEHLAACIASYFRLWRAPVLHERNPCAQPVSMERRHIPEVQNGDYVVADKSDGVRYTLFLCSEGGRSFSFLVDRKLSFYQITVAARKRAFAGSLFDGELVWADIAGGAQRSQLFLVFDAVAVKGDLDVRYENLHRRLEIIRGAFDLNGHAVSSPCEAAALAKQGKIVCGGNPFGLAFRPKLCFPMRQMDTLLRQLPFLPYPTDGLVFTPVYSPVATGTAEKTYKLKLSHTVDVEVRNRELLLGQGGNSETAPLRVLLSSSDLGLRPDDDFWRALGASCRCSMADSIIAECRLYTVGDEIQLKFMSQRTDKSHPNTVRTVACTVLNFREDLQPHELCQSPRTLIVPQDAADTRLQQVPKPVCCDASSQGGAELANLAVGDVLDFQRFADPPTPTQE